MDQSAAIEELQATFADITGGVEKTSEKLNDTYRIAQEYAAGSRSQPYRDAGHG